MINELFLRHALELSISIPAAIMAFLPVKKNVRFRWPAMMLLSGSFLIAFMLLGALVCVRFDVSTSFVLLPLLLLCFEVFTLVVHLLVFFGFFYGLAYICNSCKNCVEGNKIRLCVICNYTRKSCFT